MNLRLPQAIFLCGLSGYVAVRSFYQRRSQKHGTAVNRSSLGDRGLILLVLSGQIILPLLYIVSPWLNFANYPSMPAILGAGILIWLMGLCAFWRSHADLGANWSVTLELHESHGLVTTGVYRLVRHPMYAAFLLIAAAQALLLPNWLAGPAALAAVVVMCLVRIPKEEAMMHEYFGPAYREYCLHTGRLMPLSPDNP